MTRRLNWFLAIAALAFALPYYWLLIDNRPGDAQPKPITIEQLRNLAAQIPGEPPSAAEVELVAYRRLPGNLMVAGAGLKRKLIGVMVWRLPVPGGQAIVIDSGLTRAAADDMGFERFNDEAAARVKSALQSAGLILLTHEHIDHQGGLVALNDPAVMARARLNAQQVSGNRWTELLPWAQGARPQPSLIEDNSVAVAPGVVVIPAASHTPGSQMIFVRLGDGREFLFAGDIASFTQNWRETRARSRLVGDWFAPEDRTEVFAWLRTIAAWHQAAPDLVIVPGHDYEYFADPLRPRGAKLGFGVAAD